MTAAAPRWVRWWFTGAAVYGVPVLLPLYFVGPPGAAPESFYGFVGAALVFQLVYWTIGRDPVRYRAMMPWAVLAKLSFFVPCLLLFLQDRLIGLTMGFATIDALLAIGFALAWRATAKA